MRSGRRTLLARAASALAAPVAGAALRRALALPATLGMLGGARIAHGQGVDLDVPFVTTPDTVVLSMLELGGVGPGDYLIDLGSGDGRIPITAALRFGTRGFGVEIDPRLIGTSRDNARKAGVADKVRFDERDLFITDLSQATIITMYLLPDVNIKLRPKLLGLAPGTRIVSHDWDMGDWMPDKGMVVAAPDKRVGLVKQSKLWLWVIPARVDGRHSGAGIELSLEQKYQQLTSGVLRLGGSDYRVEPAALYGRMLRTQARSADGRTVALETASTAGSAPGSRVWTLREGSGAERRVELVYTPAPRAEPQG